ncbi:hypothetical protein OIDMADRAFT_104659 [Oidiodendron maius Zn]|uniref:NAD-dependent epimerase/dehydratase domain-containing protein n=1 Tax=Oidiodendron maius (strain Zn) TaxID=913774 RepID=A0A0C3H8Z3_OIDMZ|nr:hypothetical protein OIDMADRAFT_104659 [Oidiodendron maius Zn]
MTLPASNGQTVLITGINGYIASVLGQHLLTKGYSIRGTSRRSASSDSLLKGAYAPYKERVKIFEVPDITASGAFDEAVKGVHGIFHTASPVTYMLERFEDYITPAVKGTESIFESALKAGPQLISVVVTSSVAAIAQPTEVPGYVFTETDFATSALKRAEKDYAENVKTPPGILYAASKTSAEQVVWNFKNKHNPPFAISTIHPSVVLGPPVVLPASGSQLGESMLLEYNVFSGTAKVIPDKIGTGSFVDVRDVAFLHIWAYEHPEEANGERYIAAASYGPLQGIADILRKKYEGTKIAENITIGVPGNDYQGYNKETGEVDFVEYLPESPRPSGKKAEEVTGIKWIPFKQSVIDTATALEALL